VKKFKHQNIVLFGGGRWARVIASVLYEVTSVNDKIFWVSQHNYGLLSKWVKKYDHDRVTLLENDELIWEKDINACIVATSPSTHAYYAEKAIRLCIPTLVEKPFVINTSDANYLLSLAQEKNCPVGINLVFMYASYLQKFAKYFAGKSLRSIEITWIDPVLELRYGEEKRPDLYTSVAHDMFPHVWSILKILIPNLDIELADVTYTADGKITVTGKSEQTTFRTIFSRRGAERVRHIKINDCEWFLDFSQEPGFVLHNGSKNVNSWEGNKTPLYQSLETFLKVAQGSLVDSQWRTLLENCISSVHLADQVHISLQAAQYQYLGALGAKEEDLLVDHLDVLLDLFLPQVAMEGKRPPVKSKSEKKDFAAYALSLNDCGN
jgi:hypothetical protein